MLQAVRRCQSGCRLRPSGVRLISLAVVAAAGCAAGLIGPAAPAAAATLSGATWSVSKSTTSATATSYTYTFTAATSSSLSSVTMTVPSGTGGSPAVGTVSPGSLAGGSIMLSGTTLTYSFSAASVAAGTAVSIRVNGLTNTATAGSYTSTITTNNGASAVDTGTTSAVVLTSSALGSPSWSASSTTVGATGVSYTYTFTTATLAVITSFTMTVPPGTSGTPAVGSISPADLLGATVALSGTTLTVSGISTSLVAGTNVSIEITGLTNTATAGSYTSQIVTHSLLGPVDSGVTPAVSLTGTLTLTSPSSLTWAAMLNGGNQSVADTVAANQQFSVSDETGTGAGWHITVAATTFTNGTNTLPNAGTFVLTGSVSSVTATGAPSVTCVTSCTPPVNTATYPVAITTAASSPTPATVYDTAAGSGLGPVTLGGSSSANPVGWWINVPANARAGSYTSTLTVAVVSGP
jgi:hypothetical protein